MKKCKRLVFTLFVIFLSCCSTSLKQLHTTDLRKTSVQRDLLKEYFLCVCVTEGFKDKQIDKVDISQAVYFDILMYSPEAFQEVKDYTRKFVETIEHSPIEDLGNKKPIIMNCIEKFKSKELDKFVKSMDKHMLQ